jgi:predicted metal-binding protein
MIIPVFPVIDPRVRRLCIEPYPGHIKGCPNFGKKKGCPPQASMYQDLYDLSKPVYAIVNVYDFKAHVDRMRTAHPDWSDRQLGCCLYWQGTARKQLMLMINDFLRDHKGYSVETCPEAMGLNVTQTLRNAGFELEWPPVNIACQVALAGVKK